MRAASGLVAGIGVAGLALVTGCSSGGPTSLGTVTASPSSTSASPSALPSATSTTAATSAPSSTSAGPPTTLTIQRGSVPDTLAKEEQPVVEAWFAYWDFVGKALGDPGAPGSIGGVGTVATGKAAAELITQLTQQKSQGQHVVGLTKVQIKSATVSGTSGTVCSPMEDVSYSVDAGGKPVNAAQLRAPTFSARLTLAGPTWRVSEITLTNSC